MARRLGLTSLTILAALDEADAYGLDLIDRTGLLAGTAYTTLRRLEKKGLVVGQWEDPEIAEAERRPRRRYYSLEPEGRATLATERARLNGVLDRRGTRERGRA